MFQCSSSMHIRNKWDVFPSVSVFFSQNQDARGVIFSSLQVLTSDDAALFCCILWSIWKQRNNKIWNGVTDAQTFVFDRAKALLQDWKSTKLIRGISSTHQQSERISKWVKPNPGHFKCNVDASFLNVSNMVGIGMCIRDENGIFVLAKQ
ncbi:hypothetical protein MTR_2g102247 [Medicago truncatula]|uniref:Uncharacterized protein n=1 Tax=Medicago truncatula TaxID=3880 RepID=A0A072VN52_MEDTR|nr:hypothetical protein MTR_2g102247 [Medicago truncatula]